MTTQIKHIKGDNHYTATFTLVYMYMCTHLVDYATSNPHAIQNSHLEGGREKRSREKEIGSKMVAECTAGGNVLCFFTSETYVYNDRHGSVVHWL